MNSYLKALAIAALIPALLIGYAVGVPDSFVAHAQVSTPPASATLPEAVVKALQEALNKQGISVKTNGVLDDDTRAAIKKYQSQHHLPVTGEPDKATLDKLGVATAKSGEAPTAPGPAGQEKAGMGQGHMMGQGQGMMKNMMGGGQSGSGMGNPPAQGMSPAAPKN